ncbi:MAG: DUF433 domain-containing protein [Planctomycetota bacterium]
MQPVTLQHIESSNERCGGKPCIRGTRIRVWDIYVASELRGESPDEIAAQYPSLTLAQVHAALAFYWDNRDAIDQEMKRADEYVEELTRNAGLGPLARKLSGKHAGNDDPVSS